MKKINSASVIVAAVTLGFSVVTHSVLAGSQSNAKIAPTSSSIESVVIQVKDKKLHLAANNGVLRVIETENVDLRRLIRDDVINAINGIRVSSTEEFFAFFKGQINSDPVVVEVTRSSASMALKIPRQDFSNFGPPSRPSPPANESSSTVDPPAPPSTPNIEGF